MKTESIIKNKFLRAAVMLAMMLMTLTAGAQTLSGSGTPIDPYLIQSATDWETFASNVTNGDTYSDKYVKLTADISVSTMVGGTFNGTFNGAGHTITANLSGSGEGTALFCEIDGATIKNLKVEGSITTDNIRPATFASFVKGVSNIISCWSAAAISSTKTSSWVDGGAIVARVDEGATVNIHDCSFTGSVTYNGSANEGGGMVGWTQSGATANLTRCLFAPSSLTMITSQEKTYIFVSGNVRGNLTDCYYNNAAKASILQNEGTDASSMTNIDLVATLHYYGGEWQIIDGNVVPNMSANNFYTAAVSGIKSRYLYVGSGISITPAVITDDGTTLTLGTDYTATLDGDDVTSFPFSVTDTGTYTLTLTGIGSYSGTKTINFEVTDQIDGLSTDNDYLWGQTGFYYVNMPQIGTKSITLPEGFTHSFKVYDDGGKNDWYSENCNGFLVLTAPEGYVLRLSGTISIDTYSSLTVYDNNTNSGTILLQEFESQNIPTVTSTGRSMTFRFRSMETLRAGLDLSVEIISADPNNQHSVSVNNPAAGGTVAASPALASANHIIALTATPGNGYLLSGMSVTDASSNGVPVVWDGPFYNIATFQMPATDVTVIPTFTNNLTAEGGLYVKMPTKGTKTIIIPQGVQSFKVYDNGGNNRPYSNNCDGTLVLTAPAGYVLQLTGSLVTEGGQDYLTVFDNNAASGSELLYRVSKSNSVSETIIPDVISSGQSMTLNFHSNGSTNLSGLDLTVTLISTSTTYDINVNNPATGGTVVASSTPVSAGQIITLTATPESGYLLSGLSVKDAGNNIVPVMWEGSFSNTTTFRMPTSAVTVTPTFTNIWTASGGVCVNMPTTGSRTVTIPTGVTSVKVYDDGGKDGDYSDYCSGTLVLTAPTGYVLHLMGNVMTEANNDNLTVYDNSEASGTKLLNGARSSSNGTETAIPPIISNGQNMALRFASDYALKYAGLDLTATLINSNTISHVNISAVTGGIVTASVGGTDVTTAKVNDIVTLTASPESGYLLSGLTVTDADNNNVPLTWDGPFFFSTATFRMPATGVTVTPTFNSDLTANGGLYVNMPATGTKTVVIPQGVQSFKVYDDGGKNGRYSNHCSGTLVLTAPTGCLLQLKGSMTTNHDIDVLTVYDNNEASGTKLLNEVSSPYHGTKTTITTVVSSGQGMTIYFNSGILNTYAGLDLTVNILNANATYDITINNPSTGGVMAASTTSTKANQTVTLTATPGGGYLLNGVSVKDADNNTIPVTWNGLFSNTPNTATFTMPASNVTVTPKFSNNITTQEYINMPVSGTRTFDIPSAVRSFKVYDDGGPGGDNIKIGAAGNYSDNCNGTLVLTAPMYNKIQLSGTVTTQGTYVLDGVTLPTDYLTVYDNNQASGTKLINEAHSVYVYEGVNTVSIPTVISSGRSMALYFYSDDVINYTGLDLTVTLVPETNTVTFAKEGYGTYYNSQTDIELPSGIKAHIVTAKDNGGTLTYETIADGSSATKTVPAGTAVMLQKAASTVAQDINIPIRIHYDTRDFSASNLLHGSDVATTTTGDGKYYKLSYNTSGENLGWYWGTDNGAAFNSGAHKAWLVLPDGANARGFIALPDDDLTGIVDCKVTDQDSGVADSLQRERNGWYSLDGRRLSSKPSTKGVYIHNGRKEVIR